MKQERRTFSSWG